MAIRTSYPIFKAFTSTGALATGYKLYTYAAGTTTPKATYQDAAEVTAHANPIILNSLGEAEIFVSGSTKFTLTDASDVVQSGWPIDDIDPTLVKASEVSYIPSGNLTSTDVQGAIDELVVSSVTTPPPAGAFLEGGINGLDFSMSSGAPTTTVDVSIGSCRDASNMQNLELSSATTAVIGSPAANTIYHLFITTDGTTAGAAFDTDIDGATLLGGTTTFLRWIGFVVTNGSSNISTFAATADLISWGIASETVLVSGVGTSFAVVDHTAFLPEARIAGVLYGARYGGDQGAIQASDDGTNTAFYVGQPDTSASDTSASAFAYAPSQKGSMMPYNSAREFKSGLAGTSILLCQSVRIRR